MISLNNHEGKEDPSEVYHFRLLQGPVWSVEIEATAEDQLPPPISWIFGKVQWVTVLFIHDPLKEPVLDFLRPLPLGLVMGILDIVQAVRFQQLEEADPLN